MIYTMTHRRLHQQNKAHPDRETQKSYRALGVVLFFQSLDFRTVLFVLVRAFLERHFVFVGPSVQEPNDLAIHDGLLVFLRNGLHGCFQRVLKVFELVHQEITHVLGAVEPLANVFFLGLHLRKACLF